MKIQWLGHSCFLLESDGYRLVLDPYTMKDGEYPALHVSAHEALCSHEHFDHNARSAVTMLPARESPFSVETVETFHDDRGGTLRGRNTVHILRAEGLSVVHAGDLGHFPTEEQLASLRGCDVLLLPVGGYFTIDAETAKRVAEAVQPRLVIPMHYRSGAYGFSVLAEGEEFLRLFPAEQVRRLPGDTLTLTERPDFTGVVVPTFAGK